MFLSLVRPERISSPITRMAAVMAGALMREILFNGFSARKREPQGRRALAIVAAAPRRCYGARDALPLPADRRPARRALQALPRRRRPCDRRARHRALRQSRRHAGPRRPG